MKQVFSMETERDKDLMTLAETLVSCQLKRKSGSCRKSSCPTCQTYGELDLCMRQLPACDSLRVKHLAQELYSYREFQYGLDRMSPREVAVEVGRCAATVLGTIAGCIAIGAAFIGTIIGVLWLVEFR